ncbi:MAG: carboxypeptidase regulatory-like domain-containing protein [Candidatus Hydrogenedentes bacterium]|nr:carboxypeptidase regulatory-like domain-containing protein [Candidatus Hydrogenedentota bacterium]
MKRAVLSFLVAAALVGVGIGAYWATTRRPAESPRAQTPVTNVPDTPASTPDVKATSTPDNLVRVFGAVTDAATGAVIEGAQVRARREGPQEDGDAPEPAESLSDVSGVFEVRVEPGVYNAILCSAPGYTRQRNTLRTENRSELRIDFQLMRGGTISGMISDKGTQKPIEGIGVELVGAQENVMERLQSRGQDPSRRAQSQPDGSYALDGVPPGSYRLALSMRDSGYLYKPEDTVPIEVSAGSIISDVNFTLERGAEVSGTVIDTNGTPVANALVTAMPAQMIQRTMRRMNAGLLMDIEPGNARTDETGAFTVRGLEIEPEYRMLGHADGYADATSEPFTIGRNVSAPHLTITLGRGSAMSGTAKKVDGAPAANAELMLVPDSGEGWTGFNGPRTVRAADDGTFTLEHIPAGAYWLRPQADFGGGMIASRSARTRSKALRVEVDGKTDITGLEVIVADEETKDEPAQGTIRGTVVRDNDTPAADVRVEARAVGNPGRSYGATTAADGTFELTDLRGPAFDLSVSSDEGIANQPAVAVGATVTLQLTPPASISGHVTDLAGDPVPNARVSLSNEGETGKISSFISIMQGMFGGEPGGQRTDGNGHFEFTKLAPGAYVVKAESASKGSAESAMTQVAAGQDVMNLQILLNPGVSVGGTVAGPGGEPVQGATIQLAPMTQDLAANLVSEFIPAGVLKTAGTTSSAADGGFSIPQVAPGTYRLVVSHGNYAKTVVQGFSVSPGQDITGYRVTLGKGGEARGTFTLDGKPRPGAMIVMLSESGVELVQTDSQGRFQVSGLTSGPHMIAAFDPSRIGSMGEGMQFNPEVVDIAEGQTEDISLGGVGGVEVSGMINGDLGTLTLVALRKPDGTPLEGLDLTNFANLLESFRSLGGQTMVGPDGSFALDNVPPGSYTLEVYSMDFDESNPDITALLNLPRTPVHRQPIEIGVDSQPVQIDLPAP